MTTGESTNTTATATATTTTASVLCLGRNKSLQQQKQTIERDTKSLRLPLGAGDETGGCISGVGEGVGGGGGEEDKSEAKPKGGELISSRAFVVGVEADGKRRHQEIVVSCVQQQQQHPFDRLELEQEEDSEETEVEDRLIDSRSILSNKHRLKRFWEQRMEMESKLRQQEQHQKQLDVAVQRPGATQLSGGGADHWKQEECPAPDQNNNNYNNPTACSLAVECCSEGDLKGALRAADNGDSSTVGHRHQGQQPPANRKPQVAVSAAPVADASPVEEGGSGQWRSLSPNVEPSQSSFASITRQASRASSGQEQVCGASREHPSGYPASAGAVGGEPPRRLAEGGCRLDSAEQQLMSIDPLLSGRLHDGVSPQPHNGGTGVREMLTGAESEEQTASEEFCSSSSSSFGLLSMSAPAARQPVEKEAAVSGERKEHQLAHWHQHEDEQEEEEEEEEPSDSAQSGSVNTVIGLQQQQQLSLRSAELMSMAPEVEEQQEEEPAEEAEEEPIGDSNIGVAFESLHFDTEIKSSKSERVEETGATSGGEQQPPRQPVEARRSLLSRFEAVRSVCNSIASAIGDPTADKPSSTSHRTTIDNPLEADGEQQAADELSGPPSRASNGQPACTRATQVSGKEAVAETIDGGHLLQRAEFVASQPDEPPLQTAPGTPLSQRRTKLQQPPAGRLAAAELLMQTAPSKDGNELPVPKADLSSMFEANVKREIERFETASGFRKPQAKGSSKSGLTEWRIAEEIRLFNERELELKRRLEGTAELKPGVKPQQQQQQHAALGMQVEPQAQQRRNSNSSSINNKQPATDNIVRFGKNIQVPRSVGDQQLSAAKSIKLSTTAATSGDKTTISMHKFIASAGKRFVFQQHNSSSSMSSPAAATGSLTNSRHKSKSNGCLQAAPVGDAAPPADYKAIDSLTTKETPNVEPGLTRKAIETFSRLSNGNSSNNSSASSSFLSSCCTLSPNKYQQQAAGSQLSSPVAASGAGAGGAASSHQPPALTAEWKIQEELREMRTREAELRSQRHSSTNGAGSPLAANGSAKDEPAEHHEPLCNLKKTIDTFRNIPNNNNNNHCVPSKALMKNGLSRAGKQTATVQQAATADQQSMDYESKVAKQAHNNKLSMIEKWKNGLQ